MPMINCLALIGYHIRNSTDKVSHVFGKFYKFLSFSLFLCTKYYRDIIIKIPYIAVLYKANKYLQNSSNIDLINFLNWVFSMLYI